MVIKIGILIRDNKVLRETILTESEVSAPYRAENIVVTAAAGALQDIIDEISIVPLILQI